MRYYDVRMGSQDRAQLRGQRAIAEFLRISVTTLRARAVFGSPLARIIRVEPGGRKGLWVAWEDELAEFRSANLPTLEEHLRRHADGLPYTERSHR